MSDRRLACAITMVKDDHYFLRRWIDHYGAFFGRDALYIVRHGDDEQIADLSEGCNLITIPGIFGENFDASRWRLLNNLANGLRGYFDFVICGDVDEFVVVDPMSGLGLDDFLGRRKRRVTLTPIGLEIVHRPDMESGNIEQGIIGPRRYCRFSTAYSKPCIFNRPTDLSRGGHYAKDSELRIFRNLYLFHMRFADRGLYNETLERRSRQIDTLASREDKDLMLSRFWRRKEGDTLFDKVSRLPVRNDFDFSGEIERMTKTWGERENGLYGFDREISEELNTIPERFTGTV